MAVVCIRPPPHNGTARRVDAGESKQQAALDSGGVRENRGVAEEMPASSQRGLKCAIREQAEVTNTHEAERHDIEGSVAGIRRSASVMTSRGRDRRSLSNETGTEAIAVIDQSIIRERDAVV